MTHEHDLDAEYLHPADTRVRAVREENGETHFVLVVPCPECDQPLELDAVVEDVQDTTVEIPFEEDADVYD